MITFHLFLQLLWVVVTRNELFWFPFLSIVLYFVSNSSIPSLQSTKNPIGSLFWNLKILLPSLSLFNNSKWALQDKRNGWCEFVTFYSFDIVGQFLRWTLSLKSTSDGNRIQVPWMFYGNVIPIFVSTDLCSPCLKVILSGKYSVLNVIFQVFWSFCISFYRKSNNSFCHNFFSKLKTMLSNYLLCNFNDNNSVERMKKHYIDIHKVDKKK